MESTIFAGTGSLHFSNSLTIQFWTLEISLKIYKKKYIYILLYNIKICYIIFDSYVHSLVPKTRSGREFNPGPLLRSVWGI